MAKMPDLLPKAEKEQRLHATDPSVHAWVAANAGSGKTSILRNRVIRLLLAGATPDRILCLTYTKAAAAEMQNRIFEELARWVGLDDAHLDTAIGTILRAGPGPAGLDPHALAQARTLFARAIETPGGLKIQTIHAFAERILRVFPLESGVPLNFEILDDATTQILADEAQQACLRMAIGDAEAPLGRAFLTMVDASGLSEFASALTRASSLLGNLAIKGESLPPAAMREALLRQRLGLGPNETVADAGTQRDAALPGTGAMAEWVALLRQFKAAAGRTKLIEALEKAISEHDGGGSAWLDPLIKTFMTREGTLSKLVLAEKLQQDAPALAEGLNGLIATVRTFRAKRDAFIVLDRSLAVMTFAEAVHARFEARKRARNALDFNDLIGALRRLVRSGHAAWIMMKLDASIDHVLVDEAQDTTPDMWDILKALTEEFFAGEGGVARPRSLFVVGDEKQSIFSFQGANPADFEAARRHFGDLAGKDDPIRHPVPLLYSFRSSPDLLDLVDRIFANPRFREGVALSGDAVVHRAAWPNFPGDAELWPLVRPPIASQAPPGPRQPPAQMLAEKVAGVIRHWIDDGVCHPRDGKPIGPGDILILVRERNAFFEAVLRALKRRGLPVAGADRLTLQDHIAVQDLLAVAEAVLCPGNDLALATALRTPFFGIDEATLEAVARPRDGTLWDAVQAAPSMAAIAAHLRNLARSARRQGPYAFLATLLSSPVPDGSGLTGRKALQRRLGSDIHEPIDALLPEAQAFESREMASLLLFLLDQRSRSTDIKRDMDQRSNLIRVMTVHGSKGLEGRIVFLCDTTRSRDSVKTNEPFMLRKDAGALLVWLGSRLDKPPSLEAAFEMMRKKHREESRRLFYVALTRASDRLIIGGSLTKPPPKKDIDAGCECPLEDEGAASWYQMARAGFAQHPRVISIPDPDADAHGLGGLNRVLMRVPPSEPGTFVAMTERAGPSQATLGMMSEPAWLTTAPPEEPQPVRRLVPSALAGPERQSGPKEAGMMTSRERGIIVHRLFELLAPQPELTRMEAGAGWLRRVVPRLSAEDAESLLAPVLALLTQRDTADWFSPSSRAEAAIIGMVRLNSGQLHPVEARLDRLLILPDRTRFLDIKTGLRGDSIGEGILRQMAVYARLLGQLHAGRPVEAAILWTQTMTIETLDDATLDKAFDRIVLGDVLPEHEPHKPS